MLASLFGPGGAASSGWRSYAPLAVVAQDGQTSWLIGMLLVIMSSLPEGAIQIEGYLGVFGALLVLTLLTVAVSSLGLSPPATIAIGLAIAAAKGTLVAMFFMHLVHERGMVFMALTARALCRALG